LSLLNRQDRWEPVLENLRIGGIDRGIDQPKCGSKSEPVTILGRKMIMREAAFITGINRSFFSKYKGREVPVEDIITKLESKWMKEKTKKLRRGLR
jgi:hypothetical protein